MNQIKKIITEKKPTSVGDYFNLSKKIKEDIKNRGVEAEKKFKIAILSSFTLRGLEEVLLVKCCELGVLPEFYIGNYNQYNQEILDEQSGLYSFAPNLAIVFVDVRSMMGDLYFWPYSLSDEERKEWVTEKVREFSILLEKLKQKTKAKILFHNFEVPGYSPLGVAENKQPFGFFESVEKINSDLREAYKKDSQIFIFDFNAFSSQVGKRALLDYKMYHLADIKLDLQLLPLLGDAYVSYLKPALSQIKKCIVLDLDNTLWGGVIGEDGIEGIKLGPTPEGRPFWEFQKHLLSLFQKGIILAINSKNNLEDALKVLREHPHMILREENFASMRINWNDKVSNLKAIVEELNIGSDSLVFFDDDKLNREMVRGEMPEVAVPELPDDPSLYVSTLINLNDFHSFQITKEDKERGKMYVEQRKRYEFQGAVTDVKDYLRGLQTKVEIEDLNDFNLARIVQLIKKTNQFNMTTRRYSEEDVVKMKQEGFWIFSVGVKDKFGDNGVTGLAMIEKKPAVWKIDTFLLSCRVIGRGVEEVILGRILAEAKKNGIKILAAEFIPTTKNAPAKGFYQKVGFVLQGEENGAELWHFDVSKEYLPPDYIEVMI